MMLRLFLLFLALFGFAHTASAIDLDSFTVSPSSISEIGQTFYTTANCSSFGGDATIVFFTPQGYGFDTFTLGCSYGDNTWSFNNMNQAYYEDLFYQGQYKGVVIPNSMGVNEDCASIYDGITDEFTTCLATFPSAQVINWVNVSSGGLSFAVMTPLDASTMLANVSSGVKDTGATLWVIVALIIGMLITWEIMHRIIETFPDEKTK